MVQSPYLPSWTGIIEELAQFLESGNINADLVRAEVKRGDLLQAASYGFDRLTKPQIGEFIRHVCRYGVAKPHEIHQKIISLGPRCFVTTNYDNLLEEGLRKWLPDRFFRQPITNRNLLETAEIVHARATDFIFKPHGDAADSESIILTREQYRQLLPNGERQAALESLKMLLASRPFVYLGFGLRDPDFIYMRDLLANTYKGGTRDHYAVMADVSDAEADYWRRNYGIHLVGYATTERLDKTRDHTGLLDLLDRLLARPITTPASVGINQCTPDVILALARHAAALARTPKATPEFKIRVHAEDNKTKRYGIYHILDAFDHCPVEKFLVEGPERALLIGLPGAGKTYALRQAAAQLAEKLHEDCLSEPFNDQDVVVPLLADFKLYRGDLYELVSHTLPKSLPLDEVIQRFKVRIFLDSFNEMPREYWEAGSYEADFEKFVKRIGAASLIVGSRTNDGLSTFGMPAYCLDQIDEIAVAAEIQRLGIEIGGRFEREIRWLLQRPFYFRYITNGEIRLPKEAHPRDFFHTFFDNLRKGFATRFSGQIDIEQVLSVVAYNALNQGDEAFPLVELLDVLETSVAHIGLKDIDVLDVANWLVSSLVLMPYMGSRVAFVHQSITEYLAATELARQYQASPHILREKLSLRRWDQALFLTLSLLSPIQTKAFLKDVTEADFDLALNATKYIEVGRDDIVSQLLSEIPERIEGSLEIDLKIESAVEYHLPITEIHEPQLRRLIGSGGMVAAAAIRRLVKLKGSAVKDELLQLLLDHPSDYNMCCNGVASALKPLAIDEDAKKIAAWADSIQEKVTPDTDDDEISGFVSGGAAFLDRLDLSVIRQAFLLQNELPSIPAIRASILCEVLHHRKSTDALVFASDLLLQGINEAAFAIYLIAKYHPADCELSWDSFTTAHVDCLEAICGEPDKSWAGYALQCVCATRPDLAEVVKHIALKRTGLRKVALLYFASPTDLAPIFQVLGDLVKMSDTERCAEPLEVLDNIELNWTGKEELFVQLLKLRERRLASALMRGRVPPDIPGLGNLNIGPIGWWLEWMAELLTTDTGKWLPMQLGGLFADHLTRHVQDKFVAEFNKSDSKYRRLLMYSVLPLHSDTTTEMFSEDAISFLLADLSREGSTSAFDGHLLGRIATEQFVVEHLLPLLPSATQLLSKNLHKVLRQAGLRHGKRYVLNTQSQNRGYPQQVMDEISETNVN